VGLNGDDELGIGVRDELGQEENERLVEQDLLGGLSGWSEEGTNGRFGVKRLIKPLLRSINLFWAFWCLLELLWAVCGLLEVIGSQ
jgi:hypothetical protein